MTKVTKEDLGNVITSLAQSFDDELFALKQTELDRYWHFKWSQESSDAVNLYKFHDMLKLYGSFCRRWEEHHNGHICVVERVRDTYLMPKIRAFMTELADRSNNELTREGHE